MFLYWGWAQKVAKVMKYIHIIRRFSIFFAYYMLNHRIRGLLFHYKKNCYFATILKMKQQQHDINLRRTRKKIRVPDGIWTHDLPSPPQINIICCNWPLFFGKSIHWTSWFRLWEWPWQWAKCSRVLYARPLNERLIILLQKKNVILASIF